MLRQRYSPYLKTAQATVLRPLGKGVRVIKKSGTILSTQKIKYKPRTGVEQESLNSLLNKYHNERLKLIFNKDYQKYKKLIEATKQAKPVDKLKLYEQAERIKLKLRETVFNRLKTIKELETKLGKYGKRIKDDRSMKGFTSEQPINEPKLSTEKASSSGNLQTVQQTKKEVKVNKKNLPAVSITRLGSGVYSPTLFIPTEEYGNVKVNLPTNPQTITNLVGGSTFTSLTPEIKENIKVYQVNTGKLINLNKLDDKEVNKIVESLKLNMVGILNTKETQIQEGILNSKQKQDLTQVQKLGQDQESKLVQKQAQDQKLREGLITRQIYDKPIKIKVPTTPPPFKPIIPPIILPKLKKEELLRIIAELKKKKKKPIFQYTPTLAGLGEVSTVSKLPKFSGFEVRGSIIQLKPVKVQRYKRKKLVNVPYVRKHSRRKPRK